MITTVNMLELMQLIETSHGDPHHVLGMHEIVYKDKPALAVRAFIPQAKRIIVSPVAGGGTCYEMDKIHVDGFFEAVITEHDKWFSYILQITWHNDEVWETYDPYAFPPVISDLDLHLFGEGTHYELFSKLGSHQMMVNGVEGVLFAVWAPNAKRVSVVGSFNAWDGRRHPMRILENSGIWEIFIPGLCKYDKYKYEVKALDNSLLQKSDPYGNFFELRPSTATLIYDINLYTWHDSEWMVQRRKENVLQMPVNIYEVHPGSWRRNPETGDFMTYREMADQLIPYVKEMNYNYIELMPVEEHPFDGSWGYQVTGYYAPTSRYGTPDEFMYFVDTCHQNGIGVLLDWVPAHFPKDAHGLACFDGTRLYEHNDPRQGEHPDWGTLIFNYGRKEVKNFLIANAIFWIEKYHLDGLRVDAVASMIYLDYGKDDGEWVPNMYGGRENLEAVEFLRHMNSIILGRHPHILMIAEESTAWAGVSRPPDTGGLGFNLKWNMGWMNDFLQYVRKDPVHKKYHHGMLTFSMVYANTENFILVLSHDEVVHGKGSIINKMPGDIWQKCANTRVTYGFMYGHPGKKLLFMGGEFGQFDEWSESKELDWFMLEYEHHKQIQRFVKDLNALYLDAACLWVNDYEDNGFEWISHSDASRSIVSFFRRGSNENDVLVFVCNFTPVPHTNYLMGVPFEGSYREVLNSDDEIYGGSGIINTEILQSECSECDGRDHRITIKLPPLAVVVLKP